MKDRLLFSGCLIAFLLLSLCVIIGGARFVDELRPSVLKEAIEEKGSIRLSGQVYDIDVKEKYQILYLKNNSIIYQNKSFKESKVIIYDEKKLNIEIGNRIEVSGELSFYEEERNPGNFNQKLYYQKQGIRASVWAVEVSVKDDRADTFFQTIYVFRTQWKALLSEVLGEKDGAVLAAVLLAEKSGMNEETKELYQANGIGHILAISGLHLSVIGIGLYQIFRRLSGSFFAGGIAGISFLLLYILMIGMSVSVLRALIMFLFRVGADMAGRHYDSLTALSVSALVTIAWKPLYLFDGGFWLSYGAILGIILVFPLFERLLFQSFWASISINLVTVPIILYYFYEIPMYSVFLNMIVVPLMAVVLTCGLTGSLFCAIFVADGVFGIVGIGGILLRACAGIFKVYEGCCKIFLGLPGARLVVGQPEMWQIAVYYSVLAVIVGTWWKQRGDISSQKEAKSCRRSCMKRRICILAVILNIAMMLLPVGRMMKCASGEISITVLDVGQGDGIFIRGPEGNTYLIDGGSSDIKKVGKYRIEPFLKFQGVGTIDYIFVSHGDGDHISGIEEMIKRMDVGVAIETIVFPERGVWDEELDRLARLAMEMGVRVVEMKAGQMLREGELEFVCLAPDFDTNMADSNASSMVLALNYGEFNMLFTGDVEGEGEEKLKEYLKEELQRIYPEIHWEVLKVAHHGSRNSSTEGFLELVKPSYSIVSAGRDNSYGHPHKETVERLEGVGSEVLSTQEYGAITIVTDGEKMKVDGYLDRGK